MATRSLREGGGPTIAACGGAGSGRRWWAPARIRGIGGMRASIYNAFPVKGCEILADFMADFAKRA